MRVGIECQANVLNTYTSEGSVISSEQKSHTLTHFIESLGSLPCSYQHDPLEFYRMILFLLDRQVPARRSSEFFFCWTLWRLLSLRSFVQLLSSTVKPHRDEEYKANTGQTVGPGLICQTGRKTPYILRR